MVQLSDRNEVSLLPFGCCYIQHTFLEFRLFISLSLATWSLRPLPLYSVTIGRECGIHRLGRPRAPLRYHAQFLLQRFWYLGSIKWQVFWTDTTKGVQKMQKQPIFPRVEAGSSEDDRENQMLNLFFCAERTFPVRKTQYVNHLCAAN